MCQLAHIGHKTLRLDVYLNRHGNVEVPELDNTTHHIIITYMYLRVQNEMRTVKRTRKRDKLLGVKTA